MLARLVGADDGFCYGVGVHHEAYTLAFAHLESRDGKSRDGVWKEFQAGLTESATAGRLPLFNPARPEPTQRNRVVLTPPISVCMRDGIAPLLRTLRLKERKEPSTQPSPLWNALARMGLGDAHQMRVLVCDNDALLGNVGLFSSRRFDAEGRRLFRSLVPALKARLYYERVAATASLYRAGFDALAEQIAAPVLLLSSRGHVEHANAAALAFFADNPGRMKDQALHAARGVPSAFTVLTLANGSGQMAWAPSTADSGPRAAVWAQRLGLTKRLEQVLARVADGEANRTIAAGLGCAERTVELYMSRLLERFDVESRAALCAKFWKVSVS